MSRNNGKHFFFFFGRTDEHESNVIISLRNEGICVLIWNCIHASTQKEEEEKKQAEKNPSILTIHDWDWANRAIKYSLFIGNIWFYDQRIFLRLFFSLSTGTQSSRVFYFSSFSPKTQIGLQAYWPGLAIIIIFYFTFHISIIILIVLCVRYVWFSLGLSRVIYLDKHRRNKIESAERREKEKKTTRKTNEILSKTVLYIYTQSNIQQRHNGW